MSCTKNNVITIGIYSPYEKKVSQTYHVFNFATDEEKKIIDKMNKDKATAAEIAKLKKRYNLEIKGGLEDSDDELEFDFGDSSDVNLKTNVDTLEEQDLSRPNIYIHDVEIYPEDTIFDLKNKIYMMAKIPVYRQHIMYQGQSPMRYYSLVIDGIVYYPDITEFNDLVAGVKVSQQYYGDMKRNVIIRGFDDVDLVSNYMSPYHFEVIDLDYFKKRMQDVTTDKFTFNMVYYGLVRPLFPILTPNMFSEYISNEASIFSKYPLINTSIKTLQEKMSIQKDISRKVYIDEGQDEFFEKHMASSVESFNYFSKGKRYKMLYIRNIMNVLHNNRDLIDMCMIVSTDKDYLISKRYKYADENMLEKHSKLVLSKVKSGIEFLSILYRVPDYPQYHLLNINEDGSIEGALKSHGNDTTFADIIKLHKPIVNEIIDIINANRNITYSSDVADANMHRFGTKEIVMTNITMNIKWNETISRERFMKFEQVINKFTDGGFIKVRDNQYQKNSETHFLKLIRGIRGEKKRFSLKRDAEAINYYAVYIDIAQKKIWDSRNVGCNFNISNNTTYVSFKLENLNTQASFISCIKFIIQLVIEMSKIESEGKRKVIYKNAKKKMEELDPDLYKSESKTGVKMSRICQKKFRPIGIYTDEEYKALEDKKKRHLYQFINYTDRSTVYYECGDKLPNFGFIVGKHPKGYCIPKCKAADNEGAKNSKVQSLCMNNFTVSEGDIGKSDSNNAIKFGKIIEPGRFGYIHENIYKVLRIKNSDKYLTHNIDDSESIIDQYINIYAIKLNMNKDAMIEDIISKFTDDVYESIVSETSMQKKEMIETLKKSVSNTSFLGVVICLMYKIYNISTVTFKTIVNEQREILDNSNSTINMEINNLVDIKEGIKSSSSILAFINLRSKIMPIVYKRNIHNDYEDKFIEALIEFKEKSDEKRLKQNEFNHYSNLEKDKDIKIKEIFIASSFITNVLATYNGKTICIGVNKSAANLAPTNANRSYSAVVRDQTFDVSVVNFALERGADVTNMIFLCNVNSALEMIKTGDKIKCNFIGFRIRDDYFWFKDTSYKQLNKIFNIDESIKIEIVPYDPSKINMLLEKYKPKSNIITPLKRAEMYYKMNIYNLFKSEVYKVLKNYKSSRREELKKLKFYSKETILSVAPNISDRDITDIMSSYGRSIDSPSFIMQDDILDLWEIVSKNPSILDKIAKQITTTKRVSHEIKTIMVSDIYIKSVNFDTFKIEFHKPNSYDNSLFYTDGKLVVEEDMLDQLKKDMMIKLVFVAEVIGSNVFLVDNYFRFKLTELEEIVVSYI